MPKPRGDSPAYRRNFIRTGDFCKMELKFKGCQRRAVTPLLRFNRRTTHEPPASAQANERSNTEFDGVSNVRLYAYSAVSALMILAAGWMLVRTGDSLARQTGLGSSFVGLVLIVYSTGLVGLYAMP